MRQLRSLKFREDVKNLSVEQMKLLKGSGAYCHCLNESGPHDAFSCDECERICGGRVQNCNTIGYSFKMNESNSINMHIIMLITICFLIGCGSQNQDKSSKHQEQSNTIQEGSVLRISLADQKTLSLDEIFQEYHFIPLETLDNSLLRDSKEWKTIIDREDCLGIAELDQILFFDREGKYLKAFNHKGEDADSYRGSMAWKLDKNGDVFVMDRILSCMHVYSKEDRLKYRIKDLYDLNILDLAFLGDSLIVAKSSKRRVKNALHVMDKRTGELKRSYLPVKDHILDNCLPTFFTHYEDKLLLSMYQNNHVYELTADSAIIRYTVNVEDRLPPEGAQAFWERTDASDMQLLFEAKQKGYITHIPLFVETERTIFLRFMCDSDPDSPLSLYALIQKGDGKVTVIRDFLLDDLRWKPQVIYPLEDGRVAIPIPAYLLFEKAPAEFRKRFPNIEEEDNPILCVGKLK